MIARFAMMVLAVGALLLSGCEQKQPEPVELPPLEASVYASPEAVANAAMTTMQAELQATAERKRMLAKAHHSQLLELADAAKIQAEVEKDPVFKVVTGEDATPGVVKNWPVTIAFYRDALEVDKLSVVSRTADRAVVHVPAGEATIRLTCTRASDQRWRVARVEFAHAGNAIARRITPPAAPATSQPAP